MKHLTALRRAACRAVVLMATAQGALAGEHREGPVAPPLPKYQQECGACHLAFPPGMLPAESWQRVMATLPRHYGVDASMDAAGVNQLSTWLSTAAGNRGRVREVPPEDRITRSAWFVRKHHELPPGVWQRPAVKSAANCAACHARAELGDFDEHTVRLPR